jgi:replication factor C large subunit
MEEMVGNREVRAKLEGWLSKWKAGGKAALLVGPPGTGKTTTVHLLAEEHSLNLVELNASDTRTKQKLSHKIGEVISSTTLFGERTLIFLDEVDGLSGRADYGAIEFIKDTVKKSANPIVMAANNPDADEVKKLSGSSLRVEFKPPTVNEVLVYLRKVAEEEGLGVQDGKLFEIAESSKGDVRYALNALQSGEAGRKDEELTVAQSLQGFFDAQDRRAALAALRAYPGQPRDKLRAMLVCVTRANLPPETRARALEALSKADLLLGRMMRGKDWRLLRYFDGILASELKDALGGESVRYTQDSVPWPLQLRIWNDSRKIREMGGQAGKALAIGQKGWAVEDFPYISRLSADEEFRTSFIRSLNLDETYGSFLEKESARRAGADRRPRR